jgi:MFS family permease
MGDAAGAGSNREENPTSGWMNRTVVGAGITSALGDLCYETTTVILPGFLAVLGIPAAALGVIEGIADAVASFTKMVSGYVADKLGHRKLLVLVGYGLTPLGQGLIALALGWPMILLGRVVSWFGKGLRGPLRDAIVIQAVGPATRGRALGFHRAADTVGAVLGPLLGVAVLALAQDWHWSDASGPFRLVLWLSLIPGLLAVVAFLALVKDPQRSANPALQFFGSLRGLPTRFKRYLGAVGVFGVGDFSHALLILAATTLLTPSMGVVQAAQVAGLLYVGRNVVQAAVSWPVGWLADKAGHLAVLVVGYALGAATAGLTALAKQSCAQFLALDHPIDTQRWQLALTSRVSGGRGSLFGGAGLAAGIVALEHATNKPVIWATGQYLSLTRPDERLDLEVILPAIGRNVVQGRVVGHVGDREIITIIGAAGSRPSAAEGCWERFPAPPGPGGLPADPARSRQRESPRTHRTASGARLLRLLGIRHAERGRPLAALGAHARGRARCRRPRDHRRLHAVGGRQCARPHHALHEPGQHDPVRPPGAHPLGAL